MKARNESESTTQELSLDDLIRLTRGLGPRDFSAWARRVYYICHPLGAVQRLHADVADGNSPDLREWPELAYKEMILLDDAGILTAEAARKWWKKRYV